ncbi:penicillin-binding transpeptidase domain-containing protein [Actinoplanes friuliensis]|uniref:Peptidoglycan glycosyltransferase n=1 Tax=Actinoplanes friuliensis DSM 7358 TaxID=1246995 RepID=U5W0Y8_9ACTN|nr:penicillin-binding transpeptidase domain-containing protein [Actinoplanes friuliensis]AGZ41551.1 peptidoglycan glycosyltransferase [Actinoplanes friuliensis DSM 7358]
MRERIAFYGPPALIAGGFLLSGSLNGPWLAVTSALLVLLAHLGRGLLRRSSPGPHPGTIAGPASGVLLATLVLLEVGSLLAVRLVIVAEPDAPVSAAFAENAVRAGFWSLLVPLGGVAAVLAVLGRDTTWARGRWDRLVVRARGIRANRTLAAVVLAVVAVPFLLPLADRGDQATPLVFLGVATPEYGKLLLLAVVAGLVAADRDFFDSSLIRRPATRPWHRPALHSTTMVMAKPLALLSVIVVASGLRSDFGTLVAAFAVTLGVTWAATWSNVADRPDFGSGPAPARFSRNLRRMAAGYRFYFMIALPVLPLAVIGLFWTGYIGERGQVWLDPWAYRWGAGCAPVPQAGAGGAALLPENVIACQRSLLADTESQRSQVAAALSAVADGGLWGHGLADTASGRVPAGATDFVLAVMWNKLGGLAVLACAGLTILLGVAVVRAVRSARPGVNAATLFAAGMATMLVGQFLFVLSATVNLVPHSGVPAPLLSRGGQSTLAFLIGIIVVLALAANAPRAAGVAPVAVQGRLWGPAAMAWCVLLTIAVTLVPYPAPAMIGMGHDQKRPPCPAREATVEGLTSPPPDAARCSTDEIAVLRTRVDIRLGGEPAFRQERPAGTWHRLDGGAAGDLTEADMAGLLRVGTGESGVLDQAYARVLNGSAGTDLRRRLLPPPRTGDADGWLDLTIDPRLQHLAAAALRDPGTDGPLAGGLVVLEARTGRILAAATAPAEPATVITKTPVPEEARRSFSAEHRHYNRPSEGGRLTDKQHDPSCTSRTTEVERQRGCWLWSYAVPPPAAPEREAELRRYVDGDTAVRLPDPHINRAVGKQYGLGSTFKVITAAAYLEENPDADVDAPVLPAPQQLALSGTVRIRNAGGGPCTGAEADMISLTWALAGSCNTAFVGLAQRLGWPAIAAQAARFGLRVGSCPATDPVRPDGGVPGAAPTCVPATSDDIAIGNRALGGQDVSGTPLGMASVFAGVANGGTLVRPRLVGEVVDPSSGLRSGTPSGAGERALSTAADTKLRHALRLTATTGTAAGLATAAGTKLWVKTGTHELVPQDQPLPAGEFVRQNSWVAGWLETPRGPVAFAVVMETRDQQAGGRRARHVTSTLAKAIVESR